MFRCEPNGLGMVWPPWASPPMWMSVISLLHMPDLWACRARAGSAGTWSRKGGWAGLSSWTRAVVGVNGCSVVIRLAFSIMLWFETWPREALWLPKRKDKTRQMEGERSEAVQRQECSMRIWTEAWIGRNSVLTSTFGGSESYSGLDGRRGAGSCNEEHRVNQVEKETWLTREVERSRVQKRIEEGRGMDQERQRGWEGPRGTGGEVYVRPVEGRVLQGWAMDHEEWRHIPVKHKGKSLLFLLKEDWVKVGEGTGGTDARPKPPLANAFLPSGRVWRHRSTGAGWECFKGNQRKVSKADEARRN